jgi:hypothetical protein
MVMAMGQAEEKAARTAGTKGRPEPEEHRIQVHSTGGRPSRLYVAMPKVVFQYPGFYRLTLEEIRSVYEGAELVEGAREFSSNQDWLQRWPELLPTLDGLVFGSAPGRVVGAGVVREVVDARVRGLPVEYLERGEPRPVSKVLFQILRNPTPADFARVVDERYRL